MALGAAGRTLAQLAPTPMPFGAGAPDPRGPVPPQPPPAPAPQLVGPVAVPTLGPTTPGAATAANTVLNSAVAGAAPALAPLANTAPQPGNAALLTTANTTASTSPGPANVVPLTGAIGSPSGPVPALANPAPSLNATSGSSGNARLLPNLPASPNQARLVAIAQSLVGSRYTWAGTSPATGFDCSGFVYYVYNTYGYPLERTMAEQFAAGRRVRLEELRPGDIVFFADTYTPGLSHNGIYIGDGKFIHAVDESVGVAITPLFSSYWEQRYVGAVRIID